MSSSIAFTIDFPLDTVEMDRLRVQVIRGIVSTLTGLDVIRQECIVTIGDPRHFIVKVYAAKIPDSWIKGAEMLFRHGILHGEFRWNGERYDDKEPLSDDPLWCIEPSKTGTHWVEFAIKGTSMGDMRASTKWDGCTNLWIGDDSEDPDYCHICDLDMFTDYLKVVRDKARRYFGGEFCVSGVSEEARLKRIAEFQEEEQRL